MAEMTEEEKKDFLYTIIASLFPHDYREYPDTIDSRKYEQPLFLDIISFLLDTIGTDSAKNLYYELQHGEYHSLKPSCWLKLEGSLRCVVDGYLQDPRPNKIIEKAKGLVKEGIRSHTIEAMSLAENPRLGEIIVLAEKMVNIGNEPNMKEAVYCAENFFKDNEN